jgi:HD-GYP domain-containing protein (c-di-GMP phosphodiesterase class II)
METLTGSLFTNRRVTLLSLRWLLIIAISYLMLFHTGHLKLSWEISALILLYICSNLVLMLLPVKVFDRNWLDMGLIAADSLIVTSAMVITRLSTSHLLLFYFLIILMTTLGKGTGAVVGNGLIMMGVYLFYLFQSQGGEVFSNSGLLMQIPFLLICTVFYGVLVAQEHRKQRNVLQQIKEVSEIMVSSLNVKDIYRTTLDALINLLKADTCSIMLLEPDKKSLVVQDARGLSPELIGRARQSVGEGIAGRIVHEGRPVLLNDYPWLTPKRSQYTSQRRIVSSIGVPLKVKDQIIGVLNMASFSNKRRFRYQDLDLLTHFAAEIATSIERARLFDEVHNKAEEVRAAHFEVIQALAEALESKDVYTGGHARRLAIYADAIAHKAGLSSQEIEQLRYVAILHDVGKIAVPDVILHNTGPLTPEQWVVMKTHSEKGATILAQIGSLAHMSDFIRHHHERWDGKGYPDGLKGETIPLFSRIISVSDTYDAVTTNRSYQKAVSPTEAIGILERCAGIQLDPILVKYFIDALQSSGTLQKFFQEISEHTPSRY